MKIKKIEEKEYKETKEEEYEKKKEKKWIYIYNTIIVLNIFDLISTYICLEKGYIVEGNPLMAAVYDNSQLQFVLMKVAAIFLFMICLKIIMRKGIKSAFKVLLSFVLGMYLYVVCIHIYVYLSILTK